MKIIVILVINEKREIIEIKLMDEIIAIAVMEVMKEMNAIIEIYEIKVFKVVHMGNRPFLKQEMQIHINIKTCIKKFKWSCLCAAWEQMRDVLSIITSMPFCPRAD